MNVHVPERFQNVVLKHAVAASYLPRYPLMLAIQGQPGDGKSFQLRSVLENSAFTIIASSSALLAGNFEAEPVKQMRELYVRAKEFAAANADKLPVILLEDFDLSPAGQQDDVRYTVNSQLLAGFLMNLADDVGSCQVGTTQRFPIFLTGNDFSIVHEPLTRHGRMNIFSWEPTEEERIDVIYSIVKPYIPDTERRQIGKLSDRYKRHPIATFDAAVMDCIASAAFRHVNSIHNFNPNELRRLFGTKIPIEMDDYVDALQVRAEPRNAARSFLRSRQ
jgi:ATPase family associated with various cellular activities (AAA)